VRVPEPQPSPDDETPLVRGLLWAHLLVLTLLLTVWGGFLVPVHVGGFPAPVWLVPLAALLGLGVGASRELGLAGALVPALVWVALSWLVLGTMRSEGDLVVPPTVSGYAYLVGGLVAWAVVVLRASAADRDRQLADRPGAGASPRPGSRR
jgi:hypothetical protein